MAEATKPKKKKKKDPSGVRRFKSVKESMEHVKKTLEELHSNVLQSSNGKQ